MNFWTPNIKTRGRMIRLGLGLGLCGAAVAAWFVGHSAWLAAILGAGGLFAIFEAARGWCIVRACRIKTPF